MANQFLDIKTAAARLKLSARHVQRLCEQGKLSGAVHQGKHWRIPVSADAKLSGVQTPEELSKSAELLDIPVRKREQALRRSGLIASFEKFAADFLRGSGNRTDAIMLYCSSNNIAVRTFERWLERYRSEGLLGLVDSRGKGRFLSQTISPAAWELFKSMFLTPQQRSVKLCWQNVCYVNKSENKGWTIPSLGYLYKHIENSIPLFVRVLHREGMAAYEAKCAPFLQSDPDSVEPGQIYVGDHHELNCYIRHRNQWVRPWITAWEDMRSRKIVGWHFSVAPNQTTILRAFKMAVEKDGAPDSVKIDNGRDYDSALFTGVTKKQRRVLAKGYLDEPFVAGLYAMMGIAVSFAIPYHPQSKPLERFFDTLDCQFTKTFPTYCGKDSGRKPENLNEYLKTQKAISEADTLESFGEIASQYIEVYNHCAHGGLGMEGRSPANVLQTRQSRRLLPQGVIDLLLRVWSRELIVGKNGVNFKGLWFGQFNTEMMLHQGKKVRVAYDPDDLRSVFVYDSPALRLLTIAEQSQLIRYGAAASEEHLREAMSQKSKAIKIAKSFRNSRLTANMNLTDLTIRAMQDGAKESAIRNTHDEVANLRPVYTPLNTQIKAHQKQLALKAVRKAAGAEGLTQVIDLDLSALNPPSVCPSVFLSKTRAGAEGGEGRELDLNLTGEKEESVNLKLFDGP